MLQSKAGGDGPEESTIPDLTEEDAEESPHLSNPRQDRQDRHAMDWRGLFSASSDQALKLCSLQHQNGKVVIPEEVIEDGISQWQNSVVAQFIGRVPNFSLFQKLVNVLWGKDGEVHVKPAGPNLFIIQLPNSDARDRVLESGPWHIHNKPLIVRKWEPGLQSLDFNMRKLPVWIHLGNVPLEIFTTRGLSYIASILGNPLYMDRITARQERLAYAKICVEIEACKEIPQTIEIDMGNGSTISISVEVPWYPQKCSGCCIFGHNDKSCPFKPSVKGEVAKVWKPKVIQQAEGKKKAMAEDVQEQKKAMAEYQQNDVVVNDLPTTEALLKIVDAEDVQEQKKAMAEDHGKETKEAKTVVNAGDQGKNSSPILRSGSQNRFALLDTEKDMAPKKDLCNQENEMESREEMIETRKVRAASVGVAELMKSLKPKKKGPIDKGKIKQLKTGSSALRGQHSTSPSL